MKWHGHLIAATCVAISTFVVADFRLYAYYDNETLAATYGLTNNCIDALNSTVACDESASALLGSGIDYN
ncbi:LysM domain-containing protein, partial [Paecilomyces variotii No. 5]